MGPGGPGGSRAPGGGSRGAANTSSPPSCRHGGRAQPAGEVPAHHPQPAGTGAGPGLARRGGPQGLTGPHRALRGGVGVLGVLGGVPAV